MTDHRSITAPQRSPRPSRPGWRSRWIGSAVPAARTALVAAAVALPAWPAAAEAQRLLVGSVWIGNVLAYDPATGSFLGQLVPAGRGGVAHVYDIATGPGNRLYVASGPFNGDGAPTFVRRFDARTGADLGTFVSDPGISTPYGIGFGPDGNFYVADGETDRVLRFDGQTGASMGVFASGEGGRAFRATSWGPDGNLYVSQAAGGVARFDGSTGAALGVLAASQTSAPAGNAFGADGLLYVSDYFDGEVDVYDPANGAYVRSLTTGSGAAGLLFDDAGRLYASARFDHTVYRYTGTTGNVFTSGGPLLDPVELVLGPVPEPATWVAMLSGLLVLAWARLRRRPVPKR